MGGKRKIAERRVFGVMAQQFIKRILPDSAVEFDLFVRGQDEAPVTAATLHYDPRGNDRVWVVTCPYCWKHHVHAAGRNGESKEACRQSLGLRVAPCDLELSYRICATDSFEQEWRNCVTGEERMQGIKEQRRAWLDELKKEPVSRV